jgi:hypothetical protein
MADCSDLEKKARQSAANYDFGDLLELADCWGFRLKSNDDNHWVIIQDEYPMPSQHEMKHRYGFMNFQPANGGQAKKNQVRQLLRAIDYYRDKHER